MYHGERFNGYSHLAGTLLALASGPLLFICAGAGARLARLAAGIAFSILAFFNAATSFSMVQREVVGPWFLPDAI